MTNEQKFNDGFELAKEYIVNFVGVQHDALKKINDTGDETQFLLGIFEAQMQAVINTLICCGIDEEGSRKCIDLNIKKNFEPTLNFHLENGNIIKNDTKDC